MDALTQLTKLLAGREKTRAQARADLEKRGFSGADVDAAISRAMELGYLDDARVARRLAVAALRDGWAGEVLRARLTAKGLDEGTAAQACDDARAELEWSEPVAAAALVKKRHLDGVKAARFLAARGFSEDLCNRYGNG